MKCFYPRDIHLQSSHVSKIPSEKNVKRNILKETRKDNAKILNSHLSNDKGRKTNGLDVVLK